MPATSFKRTTAPSVRIFLGAGASRTLTVNFTPSTLGGTKETAKIVINDNANNSPQTIFLKGAGQ